MLRWSVKVLGADAGAAALCGRPGRPEPLPAAPTPFGLTSRACCQADIEGDWLRHWCRAARPRAACITARCGRMPSSLQMLWEAGMLAPGRRGLGFAVGRRRCRRCSPPQGVEMLATDLAAEDAQARGLGGTGQHGRGTDGAVPPAACWTAGGIRRAGRASARVDMARPAGGRCRTAASTWSGRSARIEHLGSIERGLAFVVRGDALPEAGRHRGAHHGVEPGRGGGGTLPRQHGALSAEAPVSAGDPAGRGRGTGCCRWMTAMRRG